MKVQNLSFKSNQKRNSKSFNDGRKDLTDRLIRKANNSFKLRKQRLVEEYAY